MLSPGAREPEASDPDSDSMDGEILSDVENEAPPDADEEETTPQLLPRKFLVFYQKKYYDVPESCVVFDGGVSLQVENGQAMGVLHECKSFGVWSKAAAGPQHMIVLEADVGGGVTQRGIYVTFKSNEGGDSPDTFILRALHKSIAKKYYSHFLDVWDEAMRTKYAEVIMREPPEVKQISPVSCHWRELSKEEEPENVLYRRKPGKSKDEDDEGTYGGVLERQDAPNKKAKTAAGNGLLEDRARAHDDDDDDASEPQSMQHAAPVLPSAMPTGPVPSGIGGAGAFNFFASTPGMVTVDLEEWRKLNAFYYSNGGR